MAAVVRATSHHGAADDGSTTDVAGTTLYMKQADTDTSGGAVPRSQNGWIKQIQLYVLSEPIHKIESLKWYWTGSAVAEISVNGKLSATYTDPVTQAATALTGTASMYGYTAGAPLSQDGDFVVGTDTAPIFIGQFLQLQTAVGASAAVASDVALGVLVARFDES